MNVYRIIAVLALSLLFCSCNRNYSELIVGTWQVDKSVSYYIENGKRIYADDIRKNDEKILLFAFYEDGQCKTSDGDVSRYHIDGDHVYIDGESLRILKLNNKKMVLDNDSYHCEFDIYYYKSNVENNQDNHTFWKTIQRIPLWIKIVVGIIIFAILIIIDNIDDEDKDNSWLDFTTIKIILYFLLAAISVSCISV